MDEMYENAVYDNEIYEMYENVDGIRDRTVFAKESEAGRQSEICLPEYLGACIGSSTPRSWTAPLSRPAVDNLSSHQHCTPNSLTHLSYNSANSSDSSKLRLLVARTDEGFSSICNRYSQFVDCQKVKRKSHQ